MFFSFFKEQNQLVSPCLNGNGELLLFLMDVARTTTQSQLYEENKTSSNVVVHVGDASTGTVHAVALDSVKYFFAFLTFFWQQIIV